MPKRDFTILLKDVTRIFVFLFTGNGKVVNFVVKLEVLISDKWTEIQRYDVYHDHVHKDIIDKFGEKITTISYTLMDNRSGLNMAIMDFKMNYEIYIRRYLNE